jgi:hypothetical protein
LARKALSNPNLDDGFKSHSRGVSQPMENKKLGRKLQSLSLENLTGRPKPAEADSDITAFFQTLHKSIDRIGKDLLEQKKAMTSEQIVNIDKKFEEFKKYLELGYLEEEAVPDKKVSFWSRFVSIFK